MKFLLFVLVASILWYFGKLIVEVISEITFTRLHSSERYKVLCKKQEKLSSSHKSNKVESVIGGKMGF